MSGPCAVDREHPHRNLAGAWTLGGVVAVYAAVGVLAFGGPSEASGALLAEPSHSTLLRPVLSGSAPAPQVPRQRANVQHGRLAATSRPALASQVALAQQTRLAGIQPGCLWLLAAPGFVLGLLLGLRRPRVSSKWSMAPVTGVVCSPGAPQGVRRRRPTYLQAAASDSSSLPRLPSLAPQPLPLVEQKPKPLLEPTTRLGQQLQYAIHSGPDHFTAFLKHGLETLSAERRAILLELRQVSAANRVLHSRISEVKLRDQRATVEDVLYATVLQQFLAIGVMPIEPAQLRRTASFSTRELPLLQRCGANVEERELIHSHTRAVLSPFGPAPGVKLCKFHVLEAFSSSILFGYHLRHLSTRYTVARLAGLNTRPLTVDEARRLFDELYNRVPDCSDDPDVAQPIDTPLVARPPLTLAQYTEGKPWKDLVGRTFLSQEVASVIRRIFAGLFGNVAELTQQQQEFRMSVKAGELDYRLRNAEALKSGKVETLVMSWESLQRLMFEAVMYGVFLKEAEAYVELTAEQPLLTPGRLS
eukprot:EG_transcript_4973